MKKIIFNDGWTADCRPVTLPRDEMLRGGRDSSSQAGDAQGFFRGGRYVYEKTFRRPAKHAFISFDGVYKNAKVFLNDVLIADVPYGYIPFTAELRDMQDTNVLRVECDNLLQPDSRWYSGAGIYRDVHLYISDGDVYIRPDGITVKTVDFMKGIINVRTETEAEEVRLTVYDGDVPIAEASGRDADIRIEDAKLWSAEDPHLYRLVARISGDEAEVSFGIRQVKRCKDGLFINGTKTLLRGGCIHHDNGLLGSVSVYEAEERRIRILKDAGFNAVRSAHNPASDALLKACDKLGMYVMDETWDMWFNHKNRYDYADFWEENHTEDIKRLIARDKAHPSVILYSLGNEVSEPASEKGKNALREMADLVHSLDDQRLVTCGLNLMIVTSAAKGKGIYDDKEGGRKNDSDKKMQSMNSTMFNLLTYLVGSGMNKAANSKRTDLICSPALDMLDIAGYNYASGRYRKDLELHPERIIVGSETMPYDIAKNWKMVEELPNLIGDFMWTAWDYMGENGIGAWGYTKDAKGFAKPYPWWLADAGAFDITGTPNAEADWARAVWHKTEKPLIDVRPLNRDTKPIKGVWRGTNGIASYSWSGCEGKKAVIEVFFDAYETELIINGKSIGRKKMKDKRAVFRTVYVPGTVEAVSYDEKGNETARNSLSSAGPDTGLVIRPEKPEVREGETVFVWVTVEDANGTIESNKDVRTGIEVENGELLAFGSACPRTEEDILEGEYTTYYGRALAVVRAGRPGTMTLRAGNTNASVTVN